MNMSLFGSLMPGFDDDPFFSGHRNMFRQMDRMMSSMMDPFGNDPFFSGGAQAITAGPPAIAAPPVLMGAPALTAGPLAHRRPAGHMRDPFGFGIPNIGALMSSMDGMAGQGNCQTFSSSTVMTMTTGPDGRPQSQVRNTSNATRSNFNIVGGRLSEVYQASASSRNGPGGVRETRRTVSDSRSGTRKMAIGHHIDDRSHIIEREHGADGGVEEKQEFINLEEEEAQQFDQEFQRRAQGSSGSGGAIGYRPRHRPSPSAYHRSSVPAITSSSHYRRRSRPMLSIAAPPSEDRARRRDREERSYRSGRH